MNDVIEFSSPVGQGDMEASGFGSTILYTEDDIIKEKKEADSGVDAEEEEEEGDKLIKAETTESGGVSSVIYIHLTIVM